MESKKYFAPELSKNLNLHYQTVIRRFKSKYANKRWGVEIEEYPDGSIKRYVPEEKLVLWSMPINYGGRPVFKSN